VVKIHLLCVLRASVVKPISVELCVLRASVVSYLRLESFTPP
jgi:hypothetical protein